jgi:exodeoxyribonuclease V alpha subunit
VTRPDRFPGVPERLQPFVDATVLTSGQARTAALLCSLAGADRPDVVLATALAVRAPTTGSVCVELRRIAEQVVPAQEAPSELLVTEDTGEPTPEPLNGPGVAGVVSAPELEWPDPEGWAQVVAASPLAQVAEGSVPALVVEGDRLYLHRHWVLERYIAADLSDQRRQRR